jgi:two-component system sensor histidine kinase EvgS
VEGAVQTFVHTASAKGLLLSSTADDRLAPAHVGDPLRIRQVLSNFLSNAVKFTETGGIEVRARVTEDAAAVQTVEFAVTDTGIGIAPEQQRLLFDDFAQAEATTTRRFGGSGLGLVICRRLAVLMGGDVTMESAPGAGTTLRLVLPLPVGDPAELDPSAVPAPGRPASTRPRPSRVEAEREGSLVLVADDHPVNRTVLGHQLELVGFHADVAEDGRQAFDLYRTGHYGIVLTDVNMPRLDGYELARAIRRHEQESGARRTPVIALTARRGSRSGSGSRRWRSRSSKRSTASPIPWRPEPVQPRSPSVTMRSSNCRVIESHECAGSCAAATAARASCWRRAGSP